MKDIHARRAVDRTASRVVSEGEHYEPEVPRGNAYDSDLPIPMVGRPYDVDNLAGKRTGRLTAIGYHGSRLNSKGEVIHHRWVMRCDCGRWTVRRSRAIKNPRTEEDMCDKCSYIKSVRYKYGRQELYEAK